MAFQQRYFYLSMPGDLLVRYTNRLHARNFAHADVDEYANMHFIATCM